VIFTIYDSIKLYAIGIVLILIFLGVSTKFVHFENKYDHSGDGRYCNENKAVPVIILYIYELSLVISTMYLSWTTRNAPRQLNESSDIAIALLGMVALILVFLPKYFSVSTDNHEFQSKLLALCFILWTFWLHVITSGLKALAVIDANRSNLMIQKKGIHKGSKRQNFKGSVHKLSKESSEDWCNHHKFYRQYIEAINHHHDDPVTLSRFLLKSVKDKELVKILHAIQLSCKMINVEVILIH
jgi:hypothetical protein